MNEEDVCTRCGKCCHVIRKIGRQHYRTSQRCKHLNDDNTCSCYDKRGGVFLNDAKTNVCNISVEDNIKKLCWQPESCAYVKHYGLHNYKSRVKEFGGIKHEKKD